MRVLNRNSTEESFAIGSYIYKNKKMGVYFRKFPSLINSYDFVTRVRSLSRSAGIMSYEGFEDDGIVNYFEVTSSS